MAWCGIQINAILLEFVFSYDFRGTTRNKTSERNLLLECWLMGSVREA